MANRKLTSLCAAVVLMGAGATANANIISLSPLTDVVGIGAQVMFDINMDFTEATVGGSFDLTYDPSILGLVSFDFNSNFITNIADPAFTVQPDNCFMAGALISGCSVGDGELNAIGFGNFNGIVGSYNIGTVVFEALATGASGITMADNDAPFEGFVSAVDGQAMTVLYGPAKVEVVVPVPAAVWMLMGGLGMLFGVRRRRND